jgi:hypothetical protein
VARQCVGMGGARCSERLGTLVQTVKEIYMLMHLRSIKYLGISK